VKADWRSTRLADVLQPIRRSETVQPAKTYDLIGVRLDGAGPFLRETKTGDQISAKKLFRVACGDFIYSRLFAWRGAFGTIGQGLDGRYVSGEFPTFVTNADRLDAEFLRLWFRLPSTLRTVESLCSGSTPLTRNRFKEQFFLDFEIPLPPLAEQQRIVARIDALAARIEEAKGLRAQAVEAVEAVTRSTARRFVGQVAETPSQLGNWLDSERQGIQTGPFGAQLGSGDFVDAGTPLITIGNVQYSGLELDALRHVNQQKADELARYDVQEGDILFARMGTVGRCCVVPAWASGWLYNYHLIRVVLDKSKVVPRYVHWSIQTSHDIEEYLVERIRGATRQGVNQEIVAGLPVRIPSLDEQQRIVTYLDDLQAKVDAVKRLQAETQAELDALLPAVLDRAFRGEL
jgi:type I restriction enzyme S subunit